MDLRIDHIGCTDGLHNPLALAECPGAELPIKERRSKKKSNLGRSTISGEIRNATAQGGEGNQMTRPRRSPAIIDL